MKKNKGFTLIELLVVIGIIAILSAVVIAFLSSARVRGQANAVQSELVNIRPQAELYHSTHGYSYAPVTPMTVAECEIAAVGDNMFEMDNNGVGVLITSILSKTGGVSNTRCAATTASWAVAVLNLSDTTKWFCYDSTGASKNFEPAVADTPIVDGLCEQSE